MPIAKIDTTIQYKYSKPCLLCGKSVSMDIPTSSSLICNECKEVWLKIKDNYKDVAEKEHVVPSGCVSLIDGHIDSLEVIDNETY